MKIAFYSGRMGKKHASRIIEILEYGVPCHRYNHYSQSSHYDLCHCVTPYETIGRVSKASRSVLALSDLRFITHPELFSLRDRLFKIPLYRFHCRHAAKIIALNGAAKDRVVKSLDLDDKRVAVCMPLQTVQYSHVDYHPTSEQMMAVRNKLGLPESYILIAGDADTMHDHGVILHAIFSLPLSLGVVVYTRRTTHSEVLLKMVRDSAAADRVQFVYEITELDLCSLYRMALLMIYMPSVESSVMPIVGALHQGVPMILSDTPTNREAAGGAAMFVPPHDQEAIAHAIKSVVYSESFRGQLIAQCWAEAKRYSQENIAEQLAKIYESAW